MKLGDLRADVTVPFAAARTQAQGLERARDVMTNHNMRRKFDRRWRQVANLVQNGEPGFDDAMFCEVVFNALREVAADHGCALTWQGGDGAMTRNNATLKGQVEMAMRRYDLTAEDMWVWRRLVCVRSLRTNGHGVACT